MAISNGVFKGVIGDKTLNDYQFKLDYDIHDLEDRIKLINELLNLDYIGSKDEFWQDVWDMGVCKVSLNKTDTLWSDSNVCKLLESMGTYLLTEYEKGENLEKQRFSRPKKEVCINKNYSTEDYDIAKNDKNYRLAPPDTIKENDFTIREIFSKDYKYYKNTIYPIYIKKLKDKISIDTTRRYGYHDGSFEQFSCSKLMSEYTWNNLKRLENEKVKLLKDAQCNLNIIKKQNQKIQQGSLYFRSCMEAEVFQYEFMNRVIPCHKQLEKSGYRNDEIKKIEEKYLYKKKKRSLGVSLRHITTNISDINEYMLICKKAYINRVYIEPDKNSVNLDILDHVDYDNSKHIESILYMQGKNISYESDMSIISYDINKAINKLFAQKDLDRKDIFIIEGIRHRISQEKIAKELNISRMTVYRRIEKIIEKIKKYI